MPNALSFGGPEMSAALRPMGAERMQAQPRTQPQAQAQMQAQAQAQAQAQMQPPFMMQTLAQSAQPFGMPLSPPPPQPSVMQPQALAGQWQQMSPLMQPDNLALKYDGKVRTAMHSQFLMALADQILTVTDWNALLSALNGHRMQGVRVLQQPVGPTAIQKQDVKFNGEEAMILSQLVQSGTFDRLKETPILTMYEYFLTIDDYCMKCAELSEKCVRHLLAVRRQATAPTTVTVETSDEGKLLPQRMSDEDIQRHKEQVPPPDFLMWGIRDLLPRHGKRRFDDANDTSDKLTGLEGLMSTQFDCGLTWVSNMTNYYKTDTMSPEDVKVYSKKANSASHIIGKTPYQRCLDEAVLLSHSFYNDYAAICEGLFRVHFLNDARKLRAPDTSNWDENSIIQRVLWIGEFDKDNTIPKLEKPFYDLLQKSVGDTVLKTDPTATGGSWAVGNALLKSLNGTINQIEGVSPISDALIAKGDWINAHFNAIVSGSAARSGLLQPKSVPWREYGDNYIRKIIGYWTGQDLQDASWRRTNLVQTLPAAGGAIGEYFAAYVAPCVVSNAGKEIHRDRASAEKAKQLVASELNGRWMWRTATVERYQQNINSPIVQKDACVSAAPFPYLPELERAGNDTIAKELAPIVNGEGSVSSMGNAFKSFTRTQARHTLREKLWERATTLAPHPIMYMGHLGRACAKTHFDSWLKRNYLFPLMRIFNEVCTDYADTELNCPPSTEVYPVIAKDGNLYAAPASQVGVTDPTTGRVTFPAASAAASRCVLPGATPPPPVPGFARQMGEERAIAPQVKAP